MENLYKILGLNKNASEDDIKKAYRKLSKQYHPDLNNGVESREYIDIITAYKILINPEKKRIYDETGEIKSNPDDTRQKIVSNILGIFNNIISNQSINLHQNDIFDIMRNTIKDEQKKIENEIKNMNILIARYKLAGSKIKSKETFLKDFIEIRIEECKRKQTILRDAVEEGNKTIKVINKFKYRIDKLIHFISSPTTSDSTTSGAFF